MIDDRSQENLGLSKQASARERLESYRALITSAAPLADVVVDNNAMHLEISGPDEPEIICSIPPYAVINLPEVGCTENQAGSICNMSPQMAQHYGREVSLRSLARDAMELMESRWGDIEPAAFRNKNRT
nr:hypothetical protein [Martelella lutilitoris]